MAIPRRYGNIPGTYFVTSRTWESRAIFNIAPPCEIFIERLFHYRDAAAYGLHEFVLMPDHFHLLLTPGPATSLERAVQFIKGGSAKAIGDAFHFKFPVWQRGFSDHRIRDAADYATHADYIARNPVKKRFSESPAAYPWSSASAKFHCDEVPQGLKPLSTGGVQRHG